jgi:hypothetical protein
VALKFIEWPESKDINNKETRRISELHWDISWYMAN